MVASNRTNSLRTHARPHTHTSTLCSHASSCSSFRILSNVITTISPDEVEQIFTRVDSNQDGFIDCGKPIPCLACLSPVSPTLLCVSCVRYVEDEFTGFLRENPEYMQLISFRLAEKRAEEQEANERATDGAEEAAAEGQQKDA